MGPCSRRDVILVQLDATPAVDDLVVARVGEEGYVVKRLAAMTASGLTLASFNPAYAPIVVGRDGATILGYRDRAILAGRLGTLTKRRHRGRV